MIMMITIATGGAHSSQTASSTIVATADDDDDQATASTRLCPVVGRDADRDGGHAQRAALSRSADGRSRSGAEQ
jgi:hypothetical protein